MVNHLLSGNYILVTCNAKDFESSKILRTVSATSYIIDSYYFTDSYYYAKNFTHVYVTRSDADIYASIVILEYACITGCWNNAGTVGQS